MELEIAGRQSLLFDDDDAAAFVNSADALVEWHSLQIDRYDVRHLLSGPPPPRRRSRPLLLDDLSLAAQLDHERYVDLPSNSDQPDEEKDEHQADTLGYRAVGFSYGNTDDLADQKNTETEMESSGFIPRFSIPENLRQCLPPSEKVHQIISRTAMFVSKNGGQSEIILRVKQGDNPTFGFLMPGHHLHPYFRYLVEHPKILQSESDGNSQDEQKKASNENNNPNGVDGALSLLGSVYGSGEEEDDGDEAVKNEKNVAQDSTSSVNHNISNGSKKIDSQADELKDGSESINPILSNKEKVLTVKKNTLIAAPKSGTAKGMEGKSRLSSASADKAKCFTMGMTPNVEPLILEPPPELKKLIDKLVEFIMRKGKQFEETLIEQDSDHKRFPFLLPSNQYHAYYLKVLKTAEESKVNGRSSSSENYDLIGRGMGRKSSEKGFSSSDSALYDMPLESDRKEKFKMVLGKSKKETQETESKETHHVTVDASAAAAILQAATRGIKNPNLQLTSTNPPTVHVDISQSGQVRMDNAVEESGQSGNCKVPAVAPKAMERTAAVEVASEADSSEAHLTQEQKLKTERLKRAKMFVAMLKSGEVPFTTTGTSRGSSLEPRESGVSRSTGEVNNGDGKEREGSLAPADVDMQIITGEKSERNYFGVEHTERSSKRKYRSKYGKSEDEEENDDDDGDRKEHNERHSRKSAKRRDKGYEKGRTVETERKHHRRRRQTHSCSEDEGGSSTSEEGGDHKLRKSKRHRSHSRHHEDERDDDKYKEEKKHKKKHRSRHSSRERSRKRHSSKQEEDERDDHGRDEKPSRKKHRSHRSSRDKESKRGLKHHASSDDENQNRGCLDNSGVYEGRNELEEGEISCRVSEESRGIAGYQPSIEPDSRVESSLQRASSQPSVDVPDDLRAKIRAMLMETRL